LWRRRRERGLFPTGAATNDDNKEEDRHVPPTTIQQQQRGTGEGGRRKVPTMDPDFDFDSLIADYQEFDEPPPSQHPEDLFDADEWEEQPHGGADKSGPTAGTSSSSDPAHEPTDPNEGTGEPSASFERANPSQYLEVDDVPGDDGGSLDGFGDSDDDHHHEGDNNRRNKKDPYAFERYESSVIFVDWSGHLFH
jgi:hypothetical protein